MLRSKRPASFVYSPCQKTPEKSDMPGKRRETIMSMTITTAVAQTAAKKSSSMMPQPFFILSSMMLAGGSFTISKTRKAAKEASQPAAPGRSMTVRRDSTKDETVQKTNERNVPAPVQGNGLRPLEQKALPARPLATPMKMSESKAVPLKKMQKSN